MSDQVITAQKVVTFTFMILNENGEVVEQSDLPMSYIHGVDGKMFPQVEAALEGARVGDEVSVTLTPEEGFGPHDPSLSFSEKIENVPPEYQRLGAEAMFQNEAGETLTMTVTRIEDGIVTLDGNHPFAGKTMTFRIKVHAMREATREEIGTGEVQGESPLSLH